MEGGPIEPEEVESKLIELLRHARLSAELSQTKLAAMAAVSRSTVTHTEDRSSRPTIRVFLQLCNALHLDPSKLLKDALKASRSHDK